MAQSEVQICNIALLKLGVDAITSLSDNTKPARACNLLYPIARDDLLRSHLWNFAITRVALGQLTTTPVYGFSYMYQLPADDLRILSVDPDLPYKIEGKKLLSNSDAVSVKYIKQETDPTVYDSIFVDLLALRLALDLSAHLVGDPNVVNLLYKLYTQKAAEARRSDAQEDTPDKVETSTWVNSRGSGYNPFGPNWTLF